MSTVLASQQKALLAVLFDSPCDEAVMALAPYADSRWARGIKAYQANGHALAERALQAAYPVVAQLLGEESFQALARAYWHATPPQLGDISQWGSGLASFVRHDQQLDDVPYLADVALLEWALHRCASAANLSVDAASFALLSEHEPAGIQLQLSPGCAAFTSSWPVVSIVNAHLLGSPEFAVVGQRVQEVAAEASLIWRAGFRPMLRQAWADEVLFVNSLLAGQSLAEALDQAPGLAIADWLPMAVQSGLLLGARLAPDFLNTTLAVPTLP